MSFTYGNNPSGSNRDAVRVLLNDTTETGHAISDETITWLLAQHSSVYSAAAAGADMLAAQTANQVVEKKVGDLMIRKGGQGGGSVSAEYRELAKLLRSTAARKGVTGYAGGVSIAAKDTERDDTDRVAPQFSVGMDDLDPGVSESTRGVWGS